MCPARGWTGTHYVDMQCVAFAESPGDYAHCSPVLSDAAMHAGITKRRFFYAAGSSAF